MPKSLLMNSALVCRDPSRLFIDGIPLQLFFVGELAAVAPDADLYLVGGPKHVNF